MTKEKTQEQLVEEIAQNIKAISKAVSDLLNGSLNEKAVFVLLAHSTKLPQSTIKQVLYAMHDLPFDYLKKQAE